SPPSPDEARGPAHSRVQKRGATAMHAQRVVIALLTALAVADRANADASPDKLRAAVGKSLPLLERGAARVAARRDCFWCHHQAWPGRALAGAKARGFKVDGDGWQGQLGHTAGFLDGNRANYAMGKGQGGQADTAGYALWTLHAGGWQPDETTAAVVEY